MCILNRPTYYLIKVAATGGLAKKPIDIEHDKNSKAAQEAYTDEHSLTMESVVAAITAKTSGTLQYDQMYVVWENDNPKSAYPFSGYRIKFVLKCTDKEKGTWQLTGTKKPQKVQHAGLSTQPGPSGEIKTTIITFDDKGNITNKEQK